MRGWIFLGRGNCFMSARRKSDSTKVSTNDDTIASGDINDGITTNFETRSESTDDITITDINSTSSVGSDDTVTAGESNGSGIDFDATLVDESMSVEIPEEKSDSILNKWKKEKKEKKEKPEKKEKKPGKFGTSFKGLLENVGSGGWVLFLTIFLSLFIMVMVAMAVFFYSVQGEEKVMMPSVTGKPLTTAILELQTKELYPKINLRYSDLPGEEGMVLEQDPAQGSIIKAYRSVTLTVSRGLYTETLGSYVGKDADSVLATLQGLTNDVTHMEIAPIVYQQSTKPKGQILAQYPAPDTPLDRTKVYLVVSSGDEAVKTTVPNIKGMNVQQVLAQMAKSPVLFDFTALDAADGNAVVTSVEKAGEEIEMYGHVNAEIAIPATSEESNTVYGVFKYTMTTYPYPVNVRLEAADSSGNLTVLIDFAHPGGDISIPYMVKKNSVLTLFAMDKVITRQNAQ